MGTQVHQAKCTEIDIFLILPISILLEVSATSILSLQGNLYIRLHDDWGRCACYSV